MKGTKRAVLEATNKPVVVPLEDVQVGDTVEFFGLGVGDGVGGFRLGTVTKLYPGLRVIRLEKKADVDGKEVLFWRTTIHETRLLENHGPRKREVI
ncbi:MAG: hypothetical protein V3W28_01620 [Thermoplasmata archaeon]